MTNNYRLVKENIRISLNSIRSHLVRTILTVMIIAFGIMALVGIFTAIQAVNYFLKENFAMMGANTFNISNRGLRVHIGRHRHNAKPYSVITYAQATQFKKDYHFPAVTSVNITGSATATVKYQSEKTDPNIRIVGIDENYLQTAGMDLSYGRNFSKIEVQQGSHMVIMGSSVAEKLFPHTKDPVGKIVSIGAGRYRIAGILKSKGSSAAFSGDLTCLLPLNNVRQYFSRPNMNYNISVMVKDQAQMDAAIGEATGAFRLVRKDRLGEANSFTIIKSDNFANMLIENTKKIKAGAKAIGAITLLGAAIALMNIMLVSVTERTREIGIRKALGARRHTIRNQFLFEAVVIAQIGGIVGIIIGIIIGNVISLLTKSAFVVPWLWVFGGILLTFIVALASGILPANKAAKLDPIESLRYE